MAAAITRMTPLDSATGAAIFRSMAVLGKTLFVLGLIVAGVGLLLWSGIGRGWFGRLPGDINVVRPNYSFHFPIMTCLLLSLLLSAVLWLLRR